jgi:hypothetical protein
MGGHLLHDQATRQLFAGPYLQDDDAPTPTKEPGRADPLSPGSFRDDPAPQKPAPVKPHPQGIPPRPNVPPLGQPQSLQIRPQPPIPGLEVPGGAAPGENALAILTPGLIGATGAAAGVTFPTKAPIGDRIRT